MKRFHYQVTVDLLDQDEDLKNLVPRIIRDRFDGTAVKVVFIGGPIDDGDLGGTREPAGDSPDSPPAGESRLPGGSDDYLPVENRPDDSAGIGAVTLLEKISGIPSNGILVYDMVLPPPIKEGDLWKPFRNVLAGSRTDEREHELASGR